MRLENEMTKEKIAGYALCLMAGSLLADGVIFAATGALVAGMALSYPTNQE